MKKIYTFLVALFAFIQIQAQTASAVVFAETGEKFTLFLNGEKQNNVPQSNVKLKDLTGEFYQARVDFEDASLADFAFSNFAVQKGIEATYIIKRNKKGEFVMRFHSQAEMGGSTAAASPSPVNSDAKRIAEVDDDAVGGSASESVTMSTGVTGTGVNASGNTTVTQTTTTKTTPAKTTGAAGENVAIGMNVGGLNMGINVNVTDSGFDNTFEEEHSTTTTTTTTTSSTGTTAVSRPVEQPIAQPAGRCASSMSSSSFNSAKSNIESKSFEDSKMTVAKQVTKANCLTTAQIKEIMGLFSFEESKLDYAKYAYDFCYNQGDYYEINDAFTFESSIEDLDKFLQSK